MVLQSTFTKHTSSNGENTPPTVLPKSLSSRFITSTQRRRARISSRSVSSKYVVEQAARRSRKQKHASNQLKFKLRSIPNPDIDMPDATPFASTPSPTSSNTILVTLPKEIGRPDFVEVSREALVAAAPGFNEAPPQYIRECLESFGLSSLKSLALVRAEPVPGNLPSEIQVQLQPIDNFSPVNPTHMLAVFGPSPSPTASNPAPKRKITLYPVHSAYLAAYCARLPAFAPSDTAENDTAAGTPFKIPVRTLCLPSPSTYPRLSSYLYTKNAEALIAGLMPVPPTSPIVSPSAACTAEPLPQAELRKNIVAFAYQIASTYTTQVLLQHAVLVHGLWQNTCALGIFDDGLWEVLETAWAVLLAAISVGTGGTIDTVLGEDST